MREKEKQALERRRAFCRAYLRTMNEQAAARECGETDGPGMLARGTVRRELEQLRESRADVRREDVIRRLTELAFAPANDAVRLAYLGEPTEETVRMLNLSAVAEFKRNSAGSVELKLIDRVKALDALYRLLDGGSEGSEALLRALEEDDEEESGA